MVYIPKGGICISHSDAFRIVSELEELEPKICNIPIIFSEMFKDEINANDEKQLYEGVKKLVKKYSDNNEKLSIINEFTRVISGGATLDEILQISMDEAKHPSAATDITVSKDCDLH